MRPKHATVPSPDSTQRIALPRRRLRAVRARDDTSAVGKHPAAPVRILIVEDDFLVADQIAAALEEVGYEVVGIAISAEEALEMAQVRPPALVIMDVRLVGMRDGIDAAIELCRNHGIRCIFATAHRDPEAVHRAEAAAPLGWLQKPYTMASLVVAVQQGLKELGR